jgi:PEP-CTERM motif
MRKLKVAFAVLLFSVPSRSDSFLLNQGSALVNAAGGRGDFSFNFFGNGNRLENVIADEFFFFGPDIYLCAGCSLPINPFSLAIFTPPSSGHVNGTFRFLSGTASIDTTSDRIIQKGNRGFITGIAQANCGFTVCPDLDCSSARQVFKLVSTPWRYRINLLNVGDGSYQFQNARMQTVPEPGTLVLLGSGLLGLGFSLRRRWNSQYKRCSSQASSSESRYASKVVTYSVESRNHKDALADAMLNDEDAA